MQIFFSLGYCYLIRFFVEMSQLGDSDLDGEEIPLSPELSEDVRIHLMVIKGANKMLRTKVEDLSASIAGVEDRLNVRLTTGDRQRHDGLRVVTESLNRLTAVVQRLEARDARLRQSRPPSHSQGHPMVMFLTCLMLVEAISADRDEVVKLVGRTMVLVA